MVLSVGQKCLTIALIGIAWAGHPRATAPHDAADHLIQKFLARDDTQPAYRAARRLEAENGDRKGWLEAITDYSPDAGFRYEITAEGGSGYIRSKVLRAVLDAERDVIARGEMDRASLAPENYTFQANGIDADGLANILLSPRRKERVLVAGMMALNTSDGALVRVQGRLAKSPSFWIKHVDIVRTYDRVNGYVVPIALDTKVQMRLVGDAAFRMTYAYSAIAGHQLAANR